MINHLTHKDESLPQMINIISTVMEALRPPQGPYKWFLSFGTLLYFIRDKNMGVKFEQDFDISILSKVNQDLVVQLFSEWGFRLKDKLVNDQTGKAFQMVFKSHHLLAIDVYFWIENNNYWWHSYDYYGEHKNKPKEYVFKGTPSHMFKGKPWKYNWEEIAQDICCPTLYGTLLDYWYPGWFVPDRSFGQSRGKKVKTNNCKGLEKKLK